MSYKFGKVSLMKRFIARLAIVLTIAICSCLLVGCDPSTYRFEQTDFSDVVSVELVNYDNSEQKHFFSWVPDHSSELKSFDDSQLSVLEALGEDSIPDFIDTLCECDILAEYYAYDSPNGVCIMLTFSDGDFLIINCKEDSYAGYIGLYSSDGNVKKFIGCFSYFNAFKVLVNNYFHIEI